ncbi:MAG: BamA/TamA family outer membrane protein [Bacteroidota bacterium]
MHLLCKPVKHYLFLFITGLAAILTGCVIPKKYQPNKPFVFSTNINIQGDLSSAVKGDLKLKLENQLDDSLKTIIKTKYPGGRFLMNPPVFDTAAALRSVIFMDNLLHAEGYYRDSVSWDSSLTVKRKQQRVTVNFTIIPGQSYTFDSIAYRLQDAALQSLAFSRRNGSLLKKGQPYSIEIISAEMDRLVELFRNNGYYKFSRDDLNAERDTVFSALINPSLDPFEQLRLLQEAKERQLNPVMSVSIYLRNPAAVSHFRKYYIRHVDIYPDLDLLDDSTTAKYDSVRVNGMDIFNKFNKFKPSFISSKSLLRPGELFRLRNSTRTYTNYTQLNTFTQVTINIIELQDSSSLDVSIRMYPSVKQDLSVTADASYNTGDVIATGDLFGVGLNFGLNNRNVAKQAIQSSTNLRTGMEIDLGGRIIQTLQTSLSHNYSFPRLVVPQWLLKRFKNVDSLRTQRTLLNFNGAYTDRKDFYELKSLNASLAYQWSRSRRGPRRSHTWYYSPINIEYVQLNPRAQLNLLLESVPNLKFSFNTGLVISMVGGYNFIQTGADGAKKNDFRIGLEESGGLTGMFKKLDREANLYRFVKLDADFRHYINYKKSALVFRLYGGIGVPYGKDKDGNREKQLPFFKSFYAGGPYSMRAWQVRQLGIGSSPYFDTATNAKNVDRFGDIQLEGNIEYRFNLGSLFGIKIKSALFSDIGNIWYRSNYNDPNYLGAEFRINKLYTDLAVGAGTSLRADFDYFLIRFDWAYKLKDPVYSYINYGWFHDIQLLKGQFQLGINYPF